MAVSERAAPRQPSRRLDEPVGPAPRTRARRCRTQARRCRTRSSWPPSCRDHLRLAGQAGPGTTGHERRQRRSRSTPGLRPILPGDARHHHARTQQHRRPRDRAAARAPRPPAGRVRPPPVAPDARPGLPPGQGAATRPRTSPRPRRDPRRRGGAPDRGRLSRRPHPGGHRPARQRRRGDRPGRGRQAVHLQGDRPGPPRGDPRRLPQLQLRPGDRADRRRAGRQGHRGAARPERDPDRGRGPAGEGRRLRGHRVRRDARRRAVRRRQHGPDAAHPRPGAPHPGLRGEPHRARRRAPRPSST